MSSLYNKITEEPSISRYQRIFGIGPIGFLCGLISFALLWLIDRRLGHIPIMSHPGSIRIIGLIFIVIWICWHIWGIKTIRLWVTENRLCTSGPYRYVRHPLYAGGSLLGSLGISLMFNAWILLLQPLLLFAVFFILARKEEKMMLEVFGEEYERYAARTGRLFPRIFS